ncbi:MAG TPA: zf-HC2 domain-containing protein [Bryobacteraceae bacterium]|nr:zf-HC2 domain-containing protein [Bryobacteraceae bacterium]
MECSTVRRKISDYVDGALPNEERSRLRQHLGACGPCARESNQQQRIRETLRSLPRFAPPPDLTLRLRVAASKARANVQGPGRWSKFCDRCELALAHLMRPLALPAVGGFCSAVFLFSALVPTFMPTFAMARVVSPWDVPTMLTTQPMVKYVAPVAFGGDAVVDVRIDDQGRIVGYSIVSFAGADNQQLRRSIENNLIFTEFWPATAFGVPVAGTIRISYRSPANIDVKG